jgi:hypothetical protein
VKRKALIEGCIGVEINPLGLVIENINTDQRLWLTPYMVDAMLAYLNREWRRGK